MPGKTQQPAAAPPAGWPLLLPGAVQDAAKKQLRFVSNAAQDLGNPVSLLQHLPLPWRKESPASRLQHAIADAQQQHTPQDEWRARIIHRAGRLNPLEYTGIASAVTYGLSGAYKALSPQGPGCCGDDTKVGRIANVITSLPYVYVGIQTFRQRQTAAGRLWGASLAGVGMASAGFHASSGSLRHWGRKADYWAIAWSSSLLSRAVVPKLPPYFTALGAVATPFRPFFVSSCNTAAMELAFLQRARKQPSLRPAHTWHTGCAAVGVALFAIEDALPGVPLLHSAWHCLSAACCATTNMLLEDIEREQLGLNLPAELQIKPLVAEL